MSVLILFAGQFPGPTAGAKRIGYYQKGLIAAAMPADILPIGNLATGRMSHYLNLFFQPFKTANSFYKVRKKYSAVLVYGFGWLTYLLLAFVAKTNNIKLYLEVNEKPGSIYGSRLTEISWIKLINTKLTEFSFRFFDGFVVISEALATYLKPHANRDARLLNVPIIIDIDRNIGEIEKPVVHFPYLLHTGALSDRKDGMAEVFAAFAIACKALNKQLHFYLTSKVAPSDLSQLIETVINENGLEQNVHFLGDIPESKLLSLQKYCSMVIINKYRNEQNEHNFPTKLAEYLVFETPVITTGIGEMGKYLIDNENAYLVPLHDVVALADRMIYITQHPIESKKVGNNGRNIALYFFDHMGHGKRMADFFS